MGISF